VQRVLRLVIACVCAMPLMIVASPGGPAAAAGGTVSGTVTDTAGVPIGGAGVVLLRPAPGGGTQIHGQTTAGADGVYTVTGVPAGDWIVAAGAAGYAARFGNSADIAAGTSVTVADDTVVFDTVLPRTTASIAGVVTASDTGLPLAGVQVIVETTPGLPFFGLFPLDFGAYRGSAVTGADGRYTIGGLAPGNVRVTFATRYFGETGPVTGSPYVTEMYDGAPDPSTATLVGLAEDIALPGIDATLDRGATISGRVTDAEGDPVEGAPVYTNFDVDFGGTSTDADGRYTLVGLPTGTAQLYSSDPSNPGPIAYRAPGEARDFTPIDLIAGNVYTGFNFQFERYEAVSLTVLTATGSLLSPNVVACRAPGIPQLRPGFPGFGPQLTCTSGALSAPNFGLPTRLLPVGTYNAAAQLNGGQFGQQSTPVSQTVTLTLAAGAPLDCTFVIEGAGSCMPTDPATVDGDGVAAVVEDAAPNGGDGNADGVRDATQANVTSMPFAIGSGYATVVVPAPLSVTRASLLAPFNPVFGAETGEFSIEVSGLEIGATADITILRTSAGAASDLTMSPNVFGSPRRRVPAEFDGTTIVAHVSDGGPFDPSTNPVGLTPPDGVARLFAVPSILDDVPPMITCASPSPEFTQGGFGFVTATVRDDLSGVVGQTTLSQFANTFTVGPNSVTFSASDAAGNSTSQPCPYTVVARPTDTTPPTIVCNSAGVPRFPVGTVASVSAFASDAGGLATSPLMSQPVDTSTVGTFSMTFSATDLAGNTSQQSCQYTVFQADTTPPVVQCFGPGPYVIEGAPLNVFTFAFDETAPTFMLATATIDVSAEGEFTGTITATDAAGNVGRADCPYTVVSDFDDVPSAIEDGAPNAGDGNVDGTPDRVQSHVASLPQPDGTGYATVYDFMGTPFRSVTTEPFDGTGVPAGAAVVSDTYVVRYASTFASPSLNLHGDPAFNELLARTPNGWEPAPMQVFDGSPADADGSVDGAIIVRLAAANVDRTPPTVTCSVFTTFLLHQPGATVTVTAADEGSGIGVPMQTFPVDTAVLGDGYIGVQVADRAGNVARAECGYRVGVRITRMSSPRPGEVTSIQRGRVLAVRWTVADYFGRGVSDPGHFQSVDVEGGWSCPRDRNESGDRTAPGLRYLGRGRWEYGWAAPGTPGCVMLELHVAGDARAALVRIR
jgi:Carboxypeptidase regulatory-like domain